MMGLEVSNISKTPWVPASIFCAAVSVLLGFWIGPNGIYIASSAGALFALWALIVRSKKPAFVVGRGVPTVLICVHVALLVTGIALESLFLKPLSPNALVMPRLSTKYRAPDSFFELRVPEGWSTEYTHAPTEAGVRIRPKEHGNYMGISELTVRVRELEKPVQTKSSFLKKMAETFSKNQEKDGPKLFEFTTSPARLLNGGEGLWSRLVVKRFWVPLYQLSLFGIRDKKYLCSVSATGLKNHATLSEVVCLGVYESIRIKPTEK